MDSSLGLYPYVPKGTSSLYSNEYTPPSSARGVLRSVMERACEAMESLTTGIRSLTSRTISYLDETTQPARGLVHYFVHHRQVALGLPIAAVATAATAYLFQTTTPLSGAIFGTVSYIAFTAGVEFNAHYFSSESDKGVMIAAFLTHCVATAFMKTVLAVPLSYTAAVPLTIAVFAASLIRAAAIAEEDKNPIAGVFCNGYDC